MRLGIFLALVACSYALDCHRGNLIVQKGHIISKTIESSSCDGFCHRKTFANGDHDVVLMSCSDNKIASALMHTEEESCLSKDKDCTCETDNCNALDLPENIVTGEDIAGSQCYVGYWANNTNANNMPYNSGATTQCATDQVCGYVTTMIALVGGGGSVAKVEAYFCAPRTVCAGVGAQINGPPVGLQGDPNLQASCCDAPMCSNTNNPAVVPPTLTPPSTSSVLCWQGVVVNNVVQPGGLYQQCNGVCASIMISTTYNGRAIIGDLFTCDPIQLCASMNINNQCANMDTFGNQTLLSGCCCNTDTCIDPTKNPPRYPTYSSSLKCFTGVHVIDTGYQIGGEMYCDGECSGIHTIINGQRMSYYSCMPTSICLSLNIYEGCQYLAADSDLQACCCHRTDNCNVATDPSINTTQVVVTSKYPILCYEGVWLNGGPLVTGRYVSCSGECATAAFSTNLTGLLQNITLYSCDPVTMCAGLGLSGSCATIGGVLTGCCCNYDGCFDPTRQIRANLKCFSGIYVTGGGLPDQLNGGEAYCQGQCASLSTTLNGQNVTTYWCAPQETCYKLGLGFGGNNNCGTIQADTAVTGCCCTETDNCNVPPSILPNVTALPIAKDPPIVCFEGFYVNGVNQTMSRYRTCYGDCVSISMGTVVNKTTTVATLYTCDPSATCKSFKFRNTCQTVDGVVDVCCCDSNSCIDPTVNRVPGRNLTCYVGVLTPYNNTNVGAEILCGGKCANLTSVVAGQPFTSFHCLPTDNCNSLSLDNSCGTITYDRDISGCCCDSSNNCNVAVGSKANTSMPLSPPESPIACYSGIIVNGQPIVNSGFRACSGECASVTINTTMNGNLMVGSIYTCDPTSVCGGLRISDRCHNLEPGVRVCCCSTSGCIDPTKTPPKIPGRPLVCYTGIKTLYNNISVGAEQYCNGKCASVTTNLNGFPVTYYDCAPNQVCRALALYDDCNTITADRAITACCCDNYDNCNVLDPSINTTSRLPRRREFPIACASGIFVDGFPITPFAFTACSGDCASITLNTTYQGANHSATIYTCDPSTVCQQLGMINNCAMVEPGMGGCCCGSDACIDPTKFPPKLPGGQLKCYVGVNSNYLSAPIGSEMVCNGKCASLSTVVGISSTSGGYNVTTYHCVSNAICKYLELDDSCQRVAADRSIEACCCDNFNNCNVRDRSINTTIPLNPPEAPIACWSGIRVNGVDVVPSTFTACLGECASMALQTTYQGQNMTATIYTCDPTAVCGGLGVINNCVAVEPGLTGCCCNTDACIDPNKNVIPGNPLICYVGIKSTYNSLSVGAEVTCSGQCASLQAMVGGYNATVYQCVDNSICSALALSNSCNQIAFDRVITGCCCNNGKNCNVQDPSINTTLPINPNVDFPVSCWSGIYFNGNAMSAVGYKSCLGQCASITISAPYNGVLSNATLYTCDPASVCQALNLNNNCGMVEPGISGCCCGTNACLTPNTIPGKPRTCYVGAYYPANNFSVGSELACTGQCASLATMVNGNLAKSYHCVPNTFCSYLQLDNSCNRINLDAAVTGCCCNNADNCNTVNEPQIPVGPATSNITSRPITCWSGVYLDGAAITPANWQLCQGDCATAQYNSSYMNGQHTLTLYTCDPVTVCSALGLINSCGTWGAGFGGCCCQSDGCLQPGGTLPGTNLICYVGIKSTYNNLNVGAEVICNGKCASLQSVVGGYNSTVYQCIAPPICTALGLDNSCGQLTFDRVITGCCCDNGKNCNVQDPSINTTLPINPNVDFPVACWSGIYLNNTAMSPVGFQSCLGQCASISISAAYMGSFATATLYTCDPASVCQTLGLNNNCGLVEPGINGCCCGSDGCLTPTVTPGKPLNCYVGAYFAATNFSVGAEMACTGQCASLSTMVNGALAKSYHCVPASFCSYLQLDNSCNNIALDNAVTGCCCNTNDNCNVKESNIVVGPLMNVTSRPITCWTGVYLDGAAITPASYSLCRGDCATAQYNSSYMGGMHTLTLYTCDPVTVCSALGLINSCATWGTGFGGCCCQSNGCLQPGGNVPGYQLVCYVGIKSTYNNLNVGAEVACNGKCASLQSVVGGYNSTVYQCINTPICTALGLDNSCGQLNFDRIITGCCCDSGKNCNVQDPSINTTVPLNPNVDFPVACWSGIYLNNTAMSPVSYQSCLGQCASISISAAYAGSFATATLYTCDPSNVCTQLGLNNNCGNVEPGISGCCCGTDGCLNPNTKPGVPLTCYVGVYYAATNLSVGSEMACSGQCASLSTMVNGQLAKSYHCVPNSICAYLNLDNSCNTIQGDNEVTGCCCNNGNNCNTVNEPFIPVFPLPANITQGRPITCWSGVYLNGVAQTQANWQLCQGQCASATYNTSYAGGQHSLTLYTCDPVTVCEKLNLINTCGSWGTGFGGCCCQTDGCLSPTETPSNNPRNCYVGVKSPIVGVGAPAPCNGMCASAAAVVGGYNVTVYECLPRSVCVSLGLDNGVCRHIVADRAITGCCCDNADNCNVKDPSINITAPVTGGTEYPIACWSGVYVNGLAVTPASFVACKGQCASISLNTTYQNAYYGATLYTCDPSTVCSALGLNNNCGNVEPGIGGCCCNTDGCINPNTGVVPSNTPLTCYVGVYAAYNNFTSGAQVPCSGRCASLSTTYNGKLVKSYHCAPISLCKYLQVDNTCNTVQVDTAVTGCCCNSGPDCNVNEPYVQAVMAPITNNTQMDRPIVCWSGLYLNGAVVNTAGYQACQGQCATVTYTQTNGANNLTIYTCDPTAVCQGLNLNNACGSLDGTPLQGCCCNTDACVLPDGTFNVPKGTVAGLSLFVSLIVAVYTLLRQ